VSFIYMIMTFVVSLLMAITVIGWIQATVGKRLDKYQFFLPTSPDALTEAQFNQQLRRYYPPAPKKTPLSSYAEPVLGHPNGHCTSQGLREFRELIRKKYALDVEVWNSRFAHEANMPIVDDMKRRSRGATFDMLKSAKRWMDARGEWSIEEWDQVEEINRRIHELDQAEHARYASGAGPVPDRGQGLP